MWYAFCRGLVQSRESPFREQVCLLRFVMVCGERESREGMGLSGEVKFRGARNMEEASPCEMFSGYCTRNAFA